MFKRSMLVVSAALVMALPAGAALAFTGEVDDQTVPTAVCDQYQDRAQLRDAAGTGDCPYGEDGVQTRTMTRQREQVQDHAECTGDGPQTRAGSAGDGHRHGPGDGSGPLKDGPMDGNGNQFGRAGR